MKLCIPSAVVCAAIGVGLILSPAAFADMSAAVADGSATAPVLVFEDFGLAVGEAEVVLGGGVFDAAFTEAPVATTPIALEVTVYDDPVSDPLADAIPPVEIAPLGSKAAPAGTYADLTGSVHVEEVYQTPRGPFAAERERANVVETIEVPASDVAIFLEVEEVPVPTTVLTVDAGQLFRLDAWDDYRGVEMVPAPAGMGSWLGRARLGRLGASTRLAAPNSLDKPTRGPFAIAGGSFAFCCYRPGLLP